MTGFGNFNLKFPIYFGYFSVYEQFEFMLSVVEHEKRL